MKRYISFLLIILFAVLSSPLQAQDDNGCDVSVLATDYGTRISNATSFEELTELNRGLSFAIADCTPRSISNDDSLVLESTEAQTTIGPIEIEAGYYFVETNVTWNEESSNTFITARFEHDLSFTIHASYEDGHVINRQIIEVRSGGTYYTNVEAIGATHWSIIFTPVNIEETVDLLPIHGEGVEADFIGPIVLEAGFYTIDYQLTHNENSPDRQAILHIDWRSFNGEIVASEQERNVGDWSGQKVYNLRGGTYYINLATSHVSEWTVMITRQ